MKRVSVTEFKTHCLRLLDEAIASGESIELTRRGKRIAVVAPERAPSDYTPGKFRGQARIVGDIVGPVLASEELEDGFAW